MNSPLLDIIKDTFSDPAQMTPVQLKKLVSETMEFFQELQGKINSSDPKQKEEALNAALELKQTLEDQMDTLSKITGLDPSQFSGFTDAAQYTDEEREVLDEMKLKFRDMKSQNSVSTQKQKVKKPKLVIR